MLICVRCGRIIVASDNPEHYGVCGTCGVEGMTQEEKDKIEATRLKED